MWFLDNFISILFCSHIKSQNCLTNGHIFLFTCYSNDLTTHLKPRHQHSGHKADDSATDLGERGTGPLDEERHQQQARALTPSSGQHTTSFHESHACNICLILDSTHYANLNWFVSEDLSFKEKRGARGDTKSLGAYLEVQHLSTHKHASLDSVPESRYDRHIQSRPYT